MRVAHIRIVNGSPLRGLACLVLVQFSSLPISAAAVEAPSWQQRLLAAYPQALEGIDGNDLVWRDGTRMPIDDGQGVKTFEAWLEAPDIEDMFRQSYPAGQRPSPPAEDFDPGRARNEAFFAKMYGDCRTGGLEASLKEVVWLPRKSGQRLLMSSVNSVADRLAAVSRELDELPATFDRFLVPAAGGYNCRAIAGTGRLSGHGFGFAIDIAVTHAHYWRWQRPAAGAFPPYRDEIPEEIVRIFERHGFIWGGRWHHFDTMHFEYRPELLPPVAGR